MALLAVMLTWSTLARGQPTENAAELYERGTKAVDRGDYDAASRDFARADEIAPHPSALEAALLAVQRTDDAELGLELAARAERSVENERLSELAARVRAKFRNAAPTTATLPSAATPPPHTLPPPSPDRATSAHRTHGQQSGWPPAVFWVGVGLTGVVATATVASLVDTQLIHDDFEANPSGALASEGNDAQKRTRILGIATGGLAIATVVTGVFAIDWSTPEGQIAFDGEQLHFSAHF